MDAMKTIADDLNSRLDDSMKMEWFCICQNAVNELHNNGVLSGLTGDMAEAAHDPDPEKRYAFKLELARQVGEKYLSLSSGAVRGSMAVMIRIRHDPRFINCVTLRIISALETLYPVPAFMKPPMTVYLSVNGDTDTASWEKIADFINRAYPDQFGARVGEAPEDKPDRSNAGTPKTPENRNVQKPEKKKGLFAKLFGK